MLIQSQAGPLPIIQQKSGFIINPAGFWGESCYSELNPAYYTLLKTQLVWCITGFQLNASAFTGGAAGTPLIGIYNPRRSGKDIVLLQTRLGIETTGTGTTTLALNYYAIAQTVSVTGTQTQCRNMYSLMATGSVAYCMVNTANTAALASNLIAPSFSLGLTAATAVTNVQSLVENVNGAIVVAPGNYLAWGMSAATTAAKLDIGMIWVECPA